MPLVVPGIMTNSDDKTQEWTNKLVGKTFSESESSETVSFPMLSLPCLTLIDHATSSMSGDEQS
jgi:hypothetical protein